MKIIIAKTAGFCMGVRRAVELVLDTTRRDSRSIYTYGPLIHNPQVLNIFEEKGVSVIDEIPEEGNGTILIRAHGVPPDHKQNLKNSGFDVIDATCPRVIKVQTIIKKHTVKGQAAIIIGDRDHPEVVGLLGYAGGMGHVVDNLADLRSLPQFEQAIIVAQTTQHTVFFEEVIKWARRQHPHYKIYNTICDSTEKRQAEVKEMAASVDALIVVGGYASGNTQRLAKMAAQSGIHVQHVESESDIDIDALADSDCVGITAGASTPNWIIKQVYRKLETLPSKSGANWRKASFLIQRILLLTNIYIAIGAGALCYACAKLQGSRDYLPQVLISMLYVQSMHILNHLISKKSDRYNDPERAAFYAKHRLALSALAIAAGAAGLLTAYSMGLTPFVILLTMSVLGFSYNLKIFPKSIANHMKYKRLKDIPGSKTILIAVAWGIVTALFPALSETGDIYAGTFLAFIWAMTMVFVRTAFFDILDMQGDRIVGKETLPIIIGATRSIQMLKLLLMASMALLVLAGMFQLFSSLAYALVFYPLLMMMVLLASEREYMLPGIRLEFLIETHFILAGLIVILGSIFMSS